MSFAHPDRPLVRPTDKAVRDYYAAIERYRHERVVHEGALRTAFQDLLADTAKSIGWVLVCELSSRTVAGQTIRPDGTLRDRNSLPRGYWEAKDPADDLATAVLAKAAQGYPLGNTIFENAREAVLYQNGREALRVDLAQARQMADLLNLFFSHSEPNIHEFELAVSEFGERVPELARGLVDKISEAHRESIRFQQAFERFFSLCRNSLNPNLSREAVDEMLVQHLLTERLIRRIFDNADFTRRNIVASEVERVIDALVGQSFNRQEFLASLDRFYLAIEGAAAGLTDFTDKQHFLNTVYERFFQGYCVRVADTHGIVYTPQPIVDFMCASIEEILREEFGKELGDPEVMVLDPCTGTGSFVANLLRRVPRRLLGDFYRERLFANEVMLMPYYIAALNIEHAYYEIAGTYEPFEGLCFVDTLSLAERERDMVALSEVNAARVDRQTAAPITVIVGNPPYNVGQLNENDNNKNREYPAVEKRVRDTYAADSKVTNKNALSDAYVKFFRWATDRLEGRDGIVCFVTNNSFSHKIAFDGFRKHLLKDFDRVWHFDFKGDARTTGERRRREGGNIFNDMIRCGVGISVLVRLRARRGKHLLYHSVNDYLKAPEKEAHLLQHSSIGKVRWKRIKPDAESVWLVPNGQDAFRALLPIGSKEAKAEASADVQSVFKSYSGGVKTNRDAVVYDFSRPALEARVEGFAEDYNAEVDRWKRTPEEKRKTLGVDNFVKYERIQWSRDLKQDMARGRYADFSPKKIRAALYRPFCRKFLYLDRLLNEEVYGIPKLLPTPETEGENVLICCTIEEQMPFSALLTRLVPCLHVGGRQGQCFPFYIYSEDGSERRENITDWALERFRERYADTGPRPGVSGKVASEKKATRGGGDTGAGIANTRRGVVADTLSKWDIFHYVYAILYHPGYRERFGDCLRRELPRIPLAPDFRAFADAGRELARLHLDYESLEPWPLLWTETPGVPLSYRVENMRLSKDKTMIRVNSSLKLGGIPPETFSYEIGNQSVLEWVVDQYVTKTDKRTGIVSDPNRRDDPEYIVRLVGQVVRASVETMRIVSALPEAFC